jgi:large subunit ribosomal protein L9
MKIILTQEVSGLGSAGDVLEVKNGYGRNYLIPRGVAIRWTRGAEKTVESIRKNRTLRANQDAAQVAALKQKLEAAQVTVGARVGSGERLFGAVTVAEIAEALSAATGESVDKRTIGVTNPIKTLGAHQVSVKVSDDVAATVAIEVTKA